MHMHMYMYMYMYIHIYIYIYMLYEVTNGKIAKVKRGFFVLGKLTFGCISTFNFDFWLYFYF